VEMRRAAPAGGRALVFRSNLGRGGWAEMRGWSVDETPAYRTVMEERLPVEARRRLEAGEADYVTFASGSAARGFARAAGAEGRWPFSARLASLGPETSRVIRDMGWPEPLEALEASDEGLVAAVAEDAARRGRDGGQEAGGAER